MTSSAGRKRILRGIPVDDDTKALDVLDEIGPGGHFLGHDHTYKRFKTENWRSPLVDRSVYADWEASGSKNYQQRVHERMVEILEAETEPLLGREDVPGAAPHLRAGRCAAQG